MLPRLSDIRESKKLKLEDIAGQLRVAISTVSRWEAGGTNIPTKRLGEIAVAYQCEVGDIFAVPADTPAGARPVREIPWPSKVPASRFAEVEGLGSRRYLVDPETPPRAYALTVRGDSMDELVDDGSVIIVDPDDIDFWDERCFIVRSVDGVTFKEYRENPARLVPLSSNPEHKEILLGREPVEVLGHVIKWVLTNKPKRRNR